MAKRSVDDWSALFEAQVRGGLTAAQFCREQGLCPKYFSLRKRMQGAREKEGTAPSPFVRVEPVAEPRPDAPSPRVRLRLGRCEWELAGLAVGDLARLMQALA